MARYITPHAVGANNASESQDCSVRALSNVMGISYEDAHQKISLIGRQNGKPVNTGDLNDLYISLGFKITVVGNTITSRYFSRKNPTATHIAGSTIENMIGRLSRGKYIVQVRGHVFAVIDGKIFDKGSMPAGKRVVAIYTLP